MPSRMSQQEESQQNIGDGNGETITHDGNSVSNDITEDNIHDGMTSFTVLYQNQDELCERVATLQPFQNVSITTTTYNQI